MGMSSPPPSHSLSPPLPRSTTWAVVMSHLQAPLLPLPRSTTWAVVMSRCAGFESQCVELDFQYPSEGIHRRWENHYRITACAATPVQAAFVLR